MSGLLLLETDCGVGKFGLELVHVPVAEDLLVINFVPPVFNGITG